MKYQELFENDEEWQSAWDDLADLFDDKEESVVKVMESFRAFAASTSKARDDATRAQRLALAMACVGAANVSINELSRLTGLNRALLERGLEQRVARLEKEDTEAFAKELHRVRKKLRDDKGAMKILHDWVRENTTISPIPNDVTKLKELSETGEVQYHALHIREDTTVTMWSKFIKFLEGSKGESFPFIPQLRTFQYLLSDITWLRRRRAKADRQICVCTYHSGARELFLAYIRLQKQNHGPDCKCKCKRCRPTADATACMVQPYEEADFDAFLDNLMCAKEGQHHKLRCIEGRCHDCPMNAADRQHCASEMNPAKFITSRRWERVPPATSKGVSTSTTIQLVLKTQKLPDFIADFSKMMKAFVKHRFQASHTKEQRHRLWHQLSPGCAIDVIDWGSNVLLEEFCEATCGTPKSMTICPIVRRYCLLPDEHHEDAVDGTYTRTFYFSSSKDKTKTPQHTLHFEIEVNKEENFLKDNDDTPRTMKALYILTDNCVAEFKCYQALHALQELSKQLGIPVIWLACASGHNKFVSDAATAIAKRLLDEETHKPTSLVSPTTLQEDLAEVVTEFKNEYHSVSADAEHPHASKRKRGVFKLRRHFDYGDDVPKKGSMGALAVSKFKIGKDNFGVQRPLRDVFSFLFRPDGTIGSRNLPCACSACALLDWESCENKLHVSTWTPVCSPGADEACVEEDGALADDEEVDNSGGMGDAVDFETMTEDLHEFLCELQESTDLMAHDLKEGDLVACVGSDPKYKDHKYWMLRVTVPARTTATDEIDTEIRMEVPAGSIVVDGHWFHQLESCEDGMKWIRESTEEKTVMSHFLLSKVAATPVRSQRGRDVKSMFIISKEEHERVVREIEERERRAKEAQG